MRASIIPAPRIFANAIRDVAMLNVSFALAGSSLCLPPVSGFDTLKFISQVNHDAVTTS